MLDRFHSINNPALANKLNAIIEEVEQLGHQLGGSFTVQTGTLNGYAHDVSEPLLTPHLPRPPSGAKYKAQLPAMACIIATYRI
jgi:hypothetical protein